MTFNPRVAFALIVLVLPVTVAAAPSERPIVLNVPLDCQFGKSCFIQQYFDHDPGPGARDYRCGPMTYDGHDGVDLRLPTLEAQRRGVEVLAAAAGLVRAVRDGMDDINVRIAGLDSVHGRECGNGVVVKHPGGWETQYCHMAKGSLRVRTGQLIEAGAALGLVGMSGEAEFPHLHFAVRLNGAKIDPFAAGPAPASCDSAQSLWSKAAAEALAYRSPEVINAGFVIEAPTMDDVESGRAGTVRIGLDAPQLVAFVRAIGLKAGDVQTLTLRDPQGTVLARSNAAPLDRSSAQRLFFIGKRRSAKEWSLGTYQAQYEVNRGGVTVFVRRFAAELQ